MLTAGDIEFEPPAAKIWGLTSSIAVMMAGDGTLHREIMKRVQIDIHARIANEPDSWWNVRDAVDVYKRHYESIRMARAETDILFPLGLDRNSFIEKQQQMSQDIVFRLVESLTNYRLPEVQSIFVGVDTDGPKSQDGNFGAYSHLWVLNGQ